MEATIINSKNYSSAFPRASKVKRTDQWNHKREDRSGEMKEVEKSRGFLRGRKLCEGTGRGRRDKTQWHNKKGSVSCLVTEGAKDNYRLYDLPKTREY